MRAFSKFCRLIVSIEFPPLGPAAITITLYHTAKARGHPPPALLCSVVTGEALALPDASGTVTRCLASVLAILGSGTGSVGVLVSNPLPAQSNHWGDGEGASAACAAIHRAGALHSISAAAECADGLVSVGANHGRLVCG